MIIQFIMETRVHRRNKWKKQNEVNPSAYTAVTVFLIAEKLLSLWPWNFYAFSLFLLTVL